MDIELKQRVRYLEKELCEVKNKLNTITNTIRFIHTNKNDHKFYELLEKLLRLKYKSNDIFTLQEVYKYYEEILQFYNPNNNTVSIY